MSDDLGELTAIIEALIFASPDPVTLKTLVKLIDGEPAEHVEEALTSLRDDWKDRLGGLQLVEVAGGYQIVTKPELHDWVRRLFHEHSKQRLSVQALETLAVIAYRQPVTGPEIAEIFAEEIADLVAADADHLDNGEVVMRGGHRSPFLPIGVCVLLIY